MSYPQGQSFSVAILHLKIDVTASCDEQFRDDPMPTSGREVERRPVLRLQIEVTSSFNELLRDGRIPFACREVERCEPFRALVVDEGLRALRRQQRADPRFVAGQYAFPKVLT